MAQTPERLSHILTSAQVFAMTMIAVNCESFDDAVALAKKIAPDKFEPLHEDMTLHSLYQAFQAADKAPPFLRIV